MNNNQEEKHLCIDPGLNFMGISVLTHTRIIICGIIDNSKKKPH